MANKYLDEIGLARLVTKIKNHVSTSIAGLVDSAPGTLDTLNELAAALGNDPNFATTIATLIDTKCAAAKAAAILAAHPVGSYYWSDDPTSPATLFGGTWQALPAGYTLIAQGRGTDSFGNFTYTAGQTYGERMHTLTVGEMPMHRHTMAYSNPSSNGFAINENTGVTPTRANGTDKYYRSFTEYTGESSSHNNGPPAKAAYCWKRTA